jgi:hypothetical protein
MYGASRLPQQNYSRTQTSIMSGDCFSIAQGYIIWLYNTFQKEEATKSIKQCRVDLGDKVFIYLYIVNLSFYKILSLFYL